MAHFVDKIIAEIEKNQLDYKQLTIVVPSQRMISYLHAAIYKVKKKPTLAPKIVTIDKWIQDILPLPIIEKTPLLFELYEIFKNDPVEQEEVSFDSFITWAPMLLSDFDEIDRYLIPADQLFKNLHDIKVLESWDVNPEDLSKGQLKFMAFWEKLKPYYYALEKKLEQKKQTTKGKAYKQLEQDIEFAFKENKEAYFVFAGFNALSEAEIKIMKQLTSLGKASVYMDSDAYYFKDVMHEAGRFHRDLCARLEVKELPFMSDVLQHQSMEIRVIECPQFTAQAQVVGSELAKLSPSELNESLVLLADESLLSSIIKHLPAQISEANITVGLPLRQSSLRSWVDLIFRLQESFIRRGNSSIYYRDFIQFAHHPFVLGILQEKEIKIFQELEAKIIKNNWHFLDRKKINLGTRLNTLNELLFEPWKNDWNLAIQRIQQLNVHLDSCLQKENELEQAIIRRFSQSIVSLQNALLDEQAPKMSLTTFRNLFNGQWANDTIAYFGNPLEGLQVMGLLETRGLDFKNIFVFGLNEGVMPPQNSINSVIPMDLRRYFNLPTPREKQGLFAHHFYRLLHQAEKVLITYSSASESVGSSEPSRYIQQLELELAQINKNIRFEKSFYTGGNAENIDETIVASNPEIVAKIKQLLKKGVSFSMFDKFLKCPLDFYYRYVVGLGEENKVEEDIESNTLGTIIHYVLEQLFKPFEEQVDEFSERKRTQMVTVDAIQRMEKDVPLLMNKSFEEHFSRDPSIWQFGTNHINFEIAKEMVFNVLKREKELLLENPDKSLFILGLEKKLETDLILNIPFYADPIPVKIKGICDRIDQFDGVTRIIDYKSGKVESKNIKLADNPKEGRDYSEELINRKQKHDDAQKHVLQLLTYTYLYYKSTGKFTQLAGIFSFKTIKESPFFLELPDELSNEQIVQLYEQFIETVVNEMLTPHAEFRHNEKSKYCDYCG